MTKWIITATLPGGEIVQSVEITYTSPDAFEADMAHAADDIAQGRAVRMITDYGHALIPTSHIRTVTWRQICEEGDLTYRIGDRVRREADGQACTVTGVVEHGAHRGWIYLDGGTSRGRGAADPSGYVPADPGEESP